MSNNNAIRNSIYNMFRETRDNVRGVQYPTTYCPRCRGVMNMKATPDGRLGLFTCSTCKYRQQVRLQ